MNQLMAGAARADVTPPVGVHLAGYGARTAPSTGVHDRLVAAALVVDDGARRVALLTLDSAGLPVPFVEEVRAGLAASTGLPAENILIAASHTHSGPDINRDDEITRTYRATLRAALVEAGAMAWEMRQPAVLRSGQGEHYSSAKNRRPNGGPIDPQVNVLRAETVDGTPIAVFVNYTCHGTVLGADNLLISADYIGYMRAELAQYLGPDPVLLFGNGALGNINPGGYSPEVSMIGGYIPNRTFADAERLGRGLAQTVLQILSRPAATAAPVVGSASRTIALPLKERPDPVQAQAELAERRRALAALPAGVEPTVREAAQIALAYAGMSVSRAGVSEPGEPDRPDMPVAVQALRLGDTYLVGIPGEPFNEIGTAIKQRSGLGRVCVLALTNGSQGYFPIAAAYAEGGYEPFASRVKPGADKLLVEAGLAALAPVAALGDGPHA